MIKLETKTKTGDEDGHENVKMQKKKKTVVTTRHERASHVSLKSVGTEIL